MNLYYDEPRFLTESRKTLNKRIVLETTSAIIGGKCCSYGFKTHKLKDGREFCKPCAKLNLPKQKESNV